MLEGDNCLIYEFYNVVEFLSSSLISSELFIKAELVCTWSEGEGESWSPKYFFSKGQSELWPLPCRQRDGFFSLKLKKEKYSTFHPKCKLPELLLTLIKMGEYFALACIPCRFSCVSQAQFKEISAIAMPHNECFPLCWGGCLWMQLGRRGRTIFYSASLAAVSGGTHYGGSDLLCNNTESRAVGFDLDNCATLSPVSTIQDQIEEQQLFTHQQSSWMQCIFTSIPGNFFLQHLFYFIFGSFVAFCTLGYRWVRKRILS